MVGRLACRKKIGLNVGFRERRKLSNRPAPVANLIG